MASLFFPQKSLKEVARETFSLLLILSFVFVIGGILVAAWMGASRRDFGVIFGFFLAFLGAFVSGRPRLYCLWGLMLTIPLNVSKRFGQNFIGKPGGEDSLRLEISDVFLFALAGFLLFDILSGRRKGLRIPKVTFLWLMLIVIGCVWAVTGPWHLVAAYEVVRMVKVMILFLVIANELDRPAKIWHCGIALALGMIVQSGIAMDQYRTKSLIGLEMFGETTNDTIDVMSATSVQGEAVFRPSALLQHPNLLGIFMAVLLPVVIGMLMVSRQSATRTIFSLSIAAGTPALIVTLSRSSWVSAAISVSLLLFLSLFHSGLRRRALAAISVAAVFGLITVGVFFGPITQRLLRSKDDATVAREIWKQDATKMIAAAPWFGHGLNSYSFEAANYSTLAIETYVSPLLIVHHILYLWWSETGIVGLIFFCGVWASIIWSGIANLGVRDEFLFVVNAACLAAILSLVPDGFLSFTLRVNEPLRMYWMQAGMILAVRYLRFQEKRALAEQEQFVDPEPRDQPSLPQPTVNA